MSDSGARAGAIPKSDRARVRTKFEWGQYLLDCVAWALAAVLAALLRLDAGDFPSDWLPLSALIVTAIVAQGLVGASLSLYQNRYLRGSFHELKALLGVALLVALIVGFSVLFFGTSLGLPRGTGFIAALIALGLMGCIRYIRRLRDDARERPSSKASRTLVYGAGYLGNHVIRRMLTDRSSQFVPVGIVDDDDSKQRLSISGVPVLGTGANIASVASKTGATALVISIAHADATFLRSVADEGREAGLRVLVFPSLEEVLEGKSRLRDVRDIEIADLIGRHPIDTQVESMGGYLTGKRVLVTGAGGSIGSELCRQISKFHPDELVMLDRDETGLQSTQLMLEGNGLLTDRNIVLADIRDEAALAEIFGQRRPEVVFHAAALKHLPMLERFPQEAWKTNVIGTLNVLNAARAVGVSTFVNVSTDKAANPTSVLGHSKRLAEQLTAHAAHETGSRYLSVRFGNVIGSRGSLVPLFAAMIEAGGPLTVTDKDATRFFMTIPEASHLVVQAGGIGRPGEVLILDMGEPVRIMDVAERMIARSGRDIAIVFTGLREGEKLHEELMGIDESDLRPVHPKISHTSITALSPEALDNAAWMAQMLQSKGEDAHRDE